MDTLLLCLRSALLGVVEGVTEFLPVSSTGHLIVFEELLGFRGSPQFVNAYSYIIQLGAVLAVVVVYRDKIRATLWCFLPRKEHGAWARPLRQSGLWFWGMLAAACVPGFLTVMTAGDWVDARLFNAVSVAVTLMLGGAALLLADGFCAKGKPQPDRGQWLAVTPRQAVTVGLFQCLSVIPGMSRSACTIIGGRAAGFSTAAAAEFSFFLAIPVMLGMSGLKLIQIGGFAAMSASELAALAIGFAVSFLVALAVVRKFVGYLKTHTMHPFAVYRILFGAAVLALYGAGAVRFVQAP